MRRKNHKRKHRHALVGRRPLPGAVPGTIEIDPSAPRPVVRLLAYGREAWVEEEITDIKTIPSYLEKWPVTWIQVVGLGDIQVINQIGEVFKLHRLSLEDVVHGSQTAKLERYGDYLFMVAQRVRPGDPVETEQISFFAGEGYVVTFMEHRRGVFEPIRERIRTGGGRIRNEGADYLLYALFDALLDRYFPVLDQFDHRLDDLEDEIFTHDNRDTIGYIHNVKRQLRTVRRAVWPMRELAEALLRERKDFITETTRLYLRDCHDHIIRINEIAETLEGHAADLMDLHLSTVSYRMNEVMKLLTIIATIFIPLTFISGIYGMNFNTSISSWNMPELDWIYGYPFAIGLMGTVALGLLVYFRRKGWL